MIATVDLTAWATLLAAVAAMIGAIPSAWAALHVKRTIGNPSNGTPVAAQLENVAAAVTTPEGKAALGVLVSDGVDVVNDVKEAVNGGTTKVP